MAHKPRRTVLTTPLASTLTAQPLPIRDNRVTFEVLVASFDLATDPALTRLGALVHALDVGGVPVPEAAGFEAILTGVRASCTDDDQVLTAMTPVLNALYTTFGQETP